MRELDWHTDTSALSPAADLPRVAVVGRGRLGRVVSAGLRSVGVDASEPLPRGADLSQAGVILLCVPDAQLSAAAAQLAPGPVVGHCSGATGLSVLAGHEGFSLHPLMTVTLQDDPSCLAGAGAAIAATTPRALETARRLAAALDLRPFELADADRAAYHAAASIASNFLITLEAAAERVATGTGVTREVLVPLVRATIENWAALGPEQALTGPIARGDEQTVAVHRTAVAERAPELLAVYDALAEATRSLAAAGDPQTPAVIA